MLQNPYISRNICDEWKNTIKPYTDKGLTIHLYMVNYPQLL